MPLTGSNEVRVNSYVAGNQQYSSMTTLTNGNIVVTWTNYDASGGDGVKAAIVNAAGQILDTVTVNQATIGDQTLPDAAVLQSGDIAATWDDSSGSGGDGSVDAVKGQILRWDGTHLGQQGGEFLINTQHVGEQRLPAITALNGGGFAVTWTDYGQFLNLGSGGIGAAGTGDIKLMVYQDGAPSNQAPAIVNYAAGATIMAPLGRRIHSISTRRTTTQGTRSIGRSPGPTPIFLVSIPRREWSNSSPPPSRAIIPSPSPSPIPAMHRILGTSRYRLRPCRPIHG